jgi:hypothetical protein
MKKWAFAAIAYFLIVVGVYYGYTTLADPPADSTDHSHTEQHE